MFATIHYHFPFLAYGLFLAVVIVITLKCDRVFRRRFLALSLALSFSLGAAALCFCQFWSYGWQFFRSPWDSLFQGYESSNPFDYDTYAILQIPGFLLWYVAPLYTAALVARFARKWGGIVELRERPAAHGGEKERGG